MAAESEFALKGNGDVPPSFDVINADAEESESVNEGIRLLYHELGYLDRRCMLPLQPRIESGNALVRLVKRCIGKLCGFLVYPVAEEQSRINVQQANYLRKMVRQMNRLTEENALLRHELAELKEKFLE